MRLEEVKVGGLLIGDGMCFWVGVVEGCEVSG